MNDINNLGSLKKRFWARFFDTFLLILLSIIFYFLLKSNIKNNADKFILPFVTWLFLFLVFLIFNVLVPYFTNGYTIFKKFFHLKIFYFIDSKFKRLKFWSLFLREILIFFVPLLILFFLNFWLHSPLKLFDTFDFKGPFVRFCYVLLFFCFLYAIFILKNDRYHQLFFDRSLNLFVLSTNVFVRIKNMDHQNKQKGYLVNLNQEQKNCAFYDQSLNLRILAGPGTGKTTVLIERFLFLVNEKKIPQSQILVLTFTRKAAQNFCDRLKIIFPSSQKNFNVYTYHAFCYHFLRKEIPYFDQKGHIFTILDSKGQKKVFKKILKSLNFDYQKEHNLLNDLVKIVEFLQKNNILTFKDLNYQKMKHQLRSSFSSFKIEFLHSFYQKYLQHKKENYLFDYVDLLIETIKVLKEHKNIALKYQHFYRYLMIDEFQDIDLLQYQFVQLLSDQGQKIPLTIVGDPDQNIYQWRGANIEFILNFDRHFKPVKTFALNDNYRSTKKIVALANTLIKNNQNRIPKVLKATKEEGENIKIFYHDDLYRQGNFFAQEIKKLIEKNVSYNDIAILYRYNKNGAILEKSFIDYKIPYQIFKGYHFFQRVEVKTILTLLSLILEPKNYYFEDLLLQMKGFGEKTLQKTLDQANELRLSLFDYLVTTKPSFLQQFQDQINYYLRSIQRLMTFINENRPLKELTTEIYKVFIEQDLKKQLLFESRLENINILIDDLICEFEKRVASQNLNLEAKITQFLAEIDFQSFKDDVIHSKVTLMTIHSSKGLEFKHLFIFDISEKPSHFSFKSSTELEEERRLFFVALTRAEETITISGSSSNESPFLQELEKESKFIDFKNKTKSAWKIDLF